jgi:hypothetical protein
MHLRLALRRYSVSVLQRAAATAFTVAHAAELHARLQQKCEEGTAVDKALLRISSLFTLQHADLQRCKIDEIIAEEASKTFLTPAGQLRFEWACCHSQMPMELPLRWRLRLLLRPTEKAEPLLSPVDSTWRDDKVTVLVEGAMDPDARGPPATICAGVSDLRRLFVAMERLAGGVDAVDAPTATPLSRDQLRWLLSFLCGEPSDFAFDSLSGTLHAHAAATDAVVTLSDAFPWKD